MPLESVFVESVTWVDWSVREMEAFAITAPEESVTVP
jgi:hypothetical protein